MSHWHVQVVDLALSTGMLELPHPLLAHAVDVHCGLGWMSLLEKEHRPPGKDHHGNAQRNQRPENFQRNRAVNLYRDRMLVLSVLYREDADQQRHQHGKEDGHSKNEKEERVHAR